MTNPSAPAITLPAIPGKMYEQRNGEHTRVMSPTSTMMAMLGLAPTSTGGIIQLSTGRANMRTESPKDLIADMAEQATSGASMDDGKDIIQRVQNALQHLDELTAEADTSSPVEHLVKQLAKGIGVLENGTGTMTINTGEIKGVEDIPGESAKDKLFRLLNASNAPVDDVQRLRNVLDVLEKLSGTSVEVHEVTKSDMQKFLAEKNKKEEDLSAEDIEELLTKSGGGLPTTKRVGINDKEYGAAETVAPAVGTKYFTPNPLERDHFSEMTWHDDTADRNYLRRNIVHLNRRDAVDHSLAWESLAFHE